MNQHMRPEPVPFYDLGSQRRRLGTSIDEAIARVTSHCLFINGPEVAVLEKALAENLQVLGISARIAAIENALPRTFHGDPADRISAGTAIAHQLTLLTPDWRIAFHRVCPTIRYKWPKRRKRR